MVRAERARHSLTPHASANVKPRSVTRFKLIPYSQIRDLQHGTSQPFGFIVQSLIEGIAAFIVAIYHGWKLTFVILACLPLSAIVLYVISRGIQAHIELQHRYLAEASQVSSNAISNVLLVKCFNTQAYETARYVKAVGEAAIHSLRQSRVVAVQMGALGFLVFAMFMLGQYAPTIGLTSDHENRLLVRF